MCLKSIQEPVLMKQQKEYAEKCIQARCDEIIGIGGGVIMDFTKQ